MVAGRLPVGDFSRRPASYGQLPVGDLQAPGFIRPAPGGRLADARLHTASSRWATCRRPASYGQLQVSGGPGSGFGTGSGPGGMGDGEGSGIGPGGTGDGPGKGPGGGVGRGVGGSGSGPGVGPGPGVGLGGTGPGPGVGPGGTGSGPGVGPGGTGSGYGLVMVSSSQWMRRLWTTPPPTRHPRRHSPGRAHATRGQGRRRTRPTGAVRAPTGSSNVQFLGSAGLTRHA